jgi:hypothetical protein
MFLYAVGQLRCRVVAALQAAWRSAAVLAEPEEGQGSKEFGFLDWKYSITTGLLCEKSGLRRHVVEVFTFNRSQQDALFLNFTLVKNSTFFGKIYCPPSGVLLLYSQQLVFVRHQRKTVEEQSSNMVEQNMEKKQLAHKLYIYQNKWQQYDKYHLL